MVEVHERLTVDDVMEPLVALTETELRDVGGLVRRVVIREEFDCSEKCAHGSPSCRGRGSPGWHGICARRVWLSVAVEGKGGVSQEIFTPVYTPSVLARDPQVVDNWHPLGGLDLHYVNPPDYLREYGPSSEDCLYTGGTCWSDATMLEVETALSLLLDGGPRAVWAWLGEKWLPDVLEHVGSERGDEDG